MSIYWLLLLSQLLSLLFYSSANSITLPLSRVSPQSTNNTPLEILKRHAAASLSRAHLKNRFVCAKVPLSPHGYSEYTVPLSFGTPPQTLPFIMDTGSSLTWFPCAMRQEYKCSNCDLPSVDPAHYPAFTPKKILFLQNHPLPEHAMSVAAPGSPGCSKNRTSCEYMYRYGTGNTTGLLINETLALDRSVVDSFTVGCSVASQAFHRPASWGFGRALESLPSQMGLKSFSHCMVSHDFDDNPSAAVGDLVLTTATSSSSSDDKFNYTAFLTNPEHYYVGLRSISVGGVVVKVPDEHVVPNATGYGGTVIDSGTSFTVMTGQVFDLLFKEFQRQVGNKYRRDKSVESQIGLKPCYRVPAAAADIKLPQLSFNFKGGVKMVLPLSNYFSYTDNEKRTVLCMTIMSIGDELGLAPAIILGNYQQQDYYIKYDLENDRLGIRPQKCK